MPRKPREQPAKPDTPPPPPQENDEEEVKTPAEARRPQQTQRASRDNAVVEGTVPDIELFVPAPIDTKELEGLNVYQRWNRIIGEMGIIPKRGFNEHHKYWFTTDADLNSFVGPLFAKYHLVVIPAVTNVERFEPASGAKQYLTRVHFHVLVINADKPEDRFEVDWIGEGADVVDKGVYKAFTGGLKYFYMKLLQVATGDDPETFTRTDALGEMAAQGATQGQRPTASTQTRPSNRQQPEKGGRQQGVTEVQIRQVKAMTKALDGIRGTASMIDRLFETNVYDTVDGMENAEEAWAALVTFLKTRSGQDVGKLLYEMGQEQARRVQRDEAQPADSNAGAGPTEDAAPTAAEAPPGFVPDDEEMGGGYGG